MIIIADLATGFLYTDFYQLSMAQLYFQEGIAETPARFEHFFRSYPNYGNHQAGYCINAGLGTFLDWLKQARPTETDIDSLAQLTDATGQAFFQPAFLDWLVAVDPYKQLTIRAIPEGRVVHPHEPLTVVEGPLALAQLVETALLNRLNYQSLIATRAARIKQAGEGNLMLEFGLRRAQGQGANDGTRAALIGGADYSSNTGLSCQLGFQPKGTHAHSLVQAFLALGYSERQAFEKFADCFPHNCILLIDTIDTLETGLPAAIEVFQQLRCRGHQPLGVRLDSGDLAYLAVRVAEQLNKAGFEQVKIVLSNQLDELVLTQVLQQIRREAADYGLEPERLINRLVYGVGTRLITSAGDAALDGVYKLVALQKNSRWKPILKLSETPGKVPLPGCKQLYRLYDTRGRATADLLSLAGEKLDFKDQLELYHPYQTNSRRLSGSCLSQVEQLLEEQLVEGRQLVDSQQIEQCRKRCQSDLGRLHPGVRRIINPHGYHLSVTAQLYSLKKRLQRRLK